VSTPDPFPDEPNNPGILLRLVRDQRVAFLIVGSINTLIGFGLFVAADVVLDKSLDASVGPILASLIDLAIAHVIGVLIAFTLYRRFVFRVRGHVLRDLARFESVYLVSIGINAVALPALVGLGAPRIPAQAVILVATTVLSYVGHRYFSFRRTPATEPTESSSSSDPRDS
jgi:putative flippase GtrA